MVESVVEEFRLLCMWTFMFIAGNQSNVHIRFPLETDPLYYVHPFILNCAILRKIWQKKKGDYI